SPSQSARSRTADSDSSIESAIRPRPTQSVRHYSNGGLQEGDALSAARPSDGPAETPTTNPTSESNGATVAAPAGPREQHPLGLGGHEGDHQGVGEGGVEGSAQAGGRARCTLDQLLVRWGTVDVLKPDSDGRVFFRKHAMGAVELWRWVGKDNQGR